MDYNFNMDSATPCSVIGDYWFKLDSEFQPFGPLVNGGKLRQCLSYVTTMLAKREYEHIVSASSIYSPQSAIVAAVAQHFGIPCKVYFGGTSDKRLTVMLNPKIASYFDADFEIVSTGRHSVIFQKAAQFAKENNGLLIDYGMNALENVKDFFDTNANQVRNLPGDLDNLIIPCGSGITSAGILYGIYKYGIRIRTIYLVGVAPHRLDKIKKLLFKLQIPFPNNITYIHLFGESNFQYEKKMLCSYCGIILHPNYEAKVGNWLFNHSKIDLESEKTCFWIVGKEASLT